MYSTALLKRSIGPLLALALGAALLCGQAWAKPAGVVLDTAEAEAVMTVLDKLAAGESPGPDDWDRIFATAGYRRLKDREAAMRRDFTDDDFREFVLGEKLLARRDDLQRALDSWREVDAAACGRRSLAYLPGGTALDATVYPVIKPATNSFVWELSVDPAIFMYLDPTQPTDQLEWILAHELHHVGLSAASLDPPEGLDEPTRQVVRWSSAFGEGLAVLAAAGDCDADPVGAGPDSLHRHWDEGLANFTRDFAEVDAFFGGILDGSIEEIDKAGFRFFGVQGPWYTVGWKMWTLVEKEFGRPALVEAMPRMPSLLLLYDEAARGRNAAGDDPAWPLWSEPVLEACRRAAG